MANKRQPASKRLSYANDPSGIAGRIRKAREAAGLSQRDLSFPGCTPAYVSRIEKGDRIPSAQILREFARRLGVSESFLADGVEAVRPGSQFAEARAALKVGDIEAARTLVDAGLKKATNDPDRAKASWLYGEIALYTADVRDAIDALERARLLHAGLERESPDYAESLGRAYARANEYESAIGVFLRNYNHATDTEDLLARVRFGALLANAYSDSGNFAAAESVLGEVIAISDGLTDPVSRAKIYWTQSRMHALRRDGETAAFYAERAIEVLEVSDQDSYVALAHHLLAHIELDRGNTERAIELLDHAQPLVERTGRPFETANIQLERARALMRSGKRKQAASLAMGAAGILEEASPLDAGRGYSLIANVFAELGDRGRAIELYELAVERLEELPTRYLVEAYSKLAELLEDEGDSQGALAYLRKAMSTQTVAARPL